MCGRYASQTPAAAIAERFGVGGAPPALAPSWNVAPGQEAPVIRRHPGTGMRHLDLLRWGLVPHWTRDLQGARRPINARAETVAASAFFRDAFAARRAIVPADAFYEWRREGKAKQPFAAARADGDLLAMAGLWEGWRGPDGAVLRSFVILTTDANAEMRPVHDRMPVILEPAAWDTWLGGPAAALAALLHPAPAGTLRLWPVSRRVNAPTANDPELLAPLA
ncbi:MAG: SOS response-associated peptidase [Rhodospirillales bacterium]|nr:SOS response-associated peptidase [Rhodospirillales bacterium]